jgi:hypothetical protein
MRLGSIAEEPSAWAAAPYTQAAVRSAEQSCAAAESLALPDEQAFPRAAQRRPQARVHSAALQPRAVLQPAAPQAAPQRVSEERRQALLHLARRVSELPEAQWVPVQVA